MNAPDKMLMTTQAIEDAFIRLPHVEALMNKLDYLFRQNRRKAEPSNMIFYGESGVGKSRIFEKFTSMHAPIIHEEYTEIPVLYVTAPAIGGTADLAKAMLRELGSVFWDQGKINTLTNQLVCLVEQCKVKLILLDEINHLVDKGGIRTHHKTADWLKIFSKDTRIPIVMAGIPRAYKLCNANDQYRGRFRESTTIKPFSIATPTETEKFKATLLTFTKMMIGIEVIDLTNGELPRQMLFATNGYLRDIRQLLVRAVEIAFQDDHKKIRISTLAEAFRQAIYSEAPNERNPFCKEFTNTPLTQFGEPFAPREE